MTTTTTARTKVAARDLDDTDAFLRKAGLVPCYAKDLRPADRVATKATMFGVNIGPVRLSTVIANTGDEDTRTIGLGDTAEAAEVDAYTVCHIIAGTDRRTKGEILDAIALHNEGRRR